MFEYFHEEDEKANGRRAYGNRRVVAEQAGNFATNASNMGCIFVSLNRSLRYLGRERISRAVGLVSETNGVSSD